MLASFLDLSCSHSPCSSRAQPRSLSPGCTRHRVRPLQALPLLSRHPAQSQTCTRLAFLLQVQLKYPPPKKKFKKEIKGGFVRLDVLKNFKKDIKELIQCDASIEDAIGGNRVLLHELHSTVLFYQPVCPHTRQDNAEPEAIK